MDVFIKYWKGTSIFSNLYIIPIIVYILNNLKISCKIIEEISKASYHIFLTQMMYYYTIEKYIEGFLGNIIVTIFINIVICCICGYVFYAIENFLEKKSIKGESKCLK